MGSKLPRRPGDFAQRAFIVGELSTGNMTEEDVEALPPMGRELSGQARNRAVSPERRKEISRMGVDARKTLQSQTS